MNTWQEFAAKAREEILAGNLDAADQYTKQAGALKSLDAMTPPAEPVQRLPFGDTPTESAAATPQQTQELAIKAVYVKKYGDLDTSTEQVLKELYGTDNYPALLMRKNRVVNHYLKSNQIADWKLASMVLLTPGQVMAAIAGGVPVEGQYSIKATMVEAQDTLGGVLVPEELNQDMVQRLPGLTVVRSRARKFNTSRDALSFLVRTGGNKRQIGNIRSKMTSESPTGTFNTNATFGKINIPVHVNLSKVPVSKSLLEDSSMDILGQVLMPEFMTDAAILEDAQFLTGTGADEPQGILNGIAANGAPFNADVQTQVSGAAAAITFDGFVAAPYKLAGQYRQRRNPSTAFAFTSATAGLLAQLKDGQGAYLWTEMHGNNAVGAPDTLRGWQVAETEALAEVAANTYPVIFGDFSGYRIVDRVGISVQRYEDSTTADTDSVVFFCRRRYGGQVAEGYKFVAMKIAAS
jgi:HK97 family phage major capsid protein